MGGAKNDVILIVRASVYRLLVSLKSSQGKIILEVIQTRPFEGKSPSSKVCSFRENIFTYWSIYWTDVAEGSL